MSPCTSFSYPKWQFMLTSFLFFSSWSLFLFCSLSIKMIFITVFFFLFSVLTKEPRHHWNLISDVLKYILQTLLFTPNTFQFSSPYFTPFYARLVSLVWFFSLNVNSSVYNRSVDDEPLYLSTDWHAINTTGLLFLLAPSVF